MKAVAIPYVITLILGVVVIGIVGYWFITQGGKAVSTGTKAECDTLKFNYCNGFVKEWNTVKCGPLPNCLCGNNIIDTNEECDPPGSSVICEGVLTDERWDGKCSTDCKREC